MYSQRLNLGRIRSDVDALWNFAPHDVSVMQFLLGDPNPLSVARSGMAYIQKGIADITFLNITYPNKLIANIHVSWLDPQRARKLVIVGSDAMAVYDDTQKDKIQIHDKGIDRFAVLGEGLTEYTKRKLELIEAGRYLELDQLQPQALRSLAALAERYSLVLVTLRRSRPALQSQLANLGMDGCLDNVLTASEDSTVAGNPGWVIKHQLVVSAGIAVTPGDFFAGDTETDILPGQKLGIQSVAVVNGIREERFLRELNPTLIVTSIAELATSILVAG